MLKQVFNRNSDKNKKGRSSSKLPPLQNMPTSSISSSDYSMGSSGATSDCSRTPSRSHSDRQQQPTTLSNNTNNNNTNDMATLSHNLSIASPFVLSNNAAPTPRDNTTASTTTTGIIDYSNEWCATELYIEYDNGLLCKNARPFGEVLYCFVCDIGVDEPTRLTASVEQTGLFVRGMQARSSRWWNWHQ